MFPRAATGSFEVSDAVFPLSQTEVHVRDSNAKTWHHVCPCLQTLQPRGPHCRGPAVHQGTMGVMKCWWRNSHVQVPHRQLQCILGMCAKHKAMNNSCLLRTPLPPVQLLLKPSQCQIREPDLFRKAAASAANTLREGQYHPVCSIFHMKGPHLVTVSGGAGLAQPWCPHPAGGWKVGQAGRG